MKEIISFSEIAIQDIKGMSERVHRSLERIGPPGEILKALGQLEAEIQQGMKELEGMLK